MIGAVIVEDEPLACQYLRNLLHDTGKIRVLATAGRGRDGLQLCAEHRPDVAFLDIRLPGPDGMALAAHLLTLPQPPLLVFVTGYADRAAEAFRIEAVDYLLKPIEAERVSETLRRIEQRLAERNTPVAPMPTVSNLLPVKNLNEDVIKLLARSEIVAALRHDRRTWIHTAQAEFATYYPLASLALWLGDKPFLQIARDAIINLEAVEEIVHYGDRLYQVRLRDRARTVVEASRIGATRLAACLKPPF